MSVDYCPPHAPFFGFAGVAAAMVLTVIGSAYGTSKAGIGIAGLSQQAPHLVMKSLIPIVMAGIISVYGLVVSVLIVVNPAKPYSLFQGYIHLAAGLSCGLAGLAAGHAIGKVGDSGVRAYLFQSRIFVSMVFVVFCASALADVRIILILIFAEVLGLYGLIVALILNTKAGEALCFPSS